MDSTSEKLWLKRVLIPIWVIQLLDLLLLVAVSAIGLWVANKVENASSGAGVQGEYYDRAANALTTGAAVVLSIAIFMILLDIAEIVLFAKRKLKPITFLVLQCIKFLISAVFFALSAIEIARIGSTIINIVIALLLLLTTIASLIYGSVIMHRYRKRDLRKQTSQSLEVGQTLASGPVNHAVAPLYLNTGSSQHYEAVPTYEMHGNPVYEMHSNTLR